MGNRIHASERRNVFRFYPPGYFCQLFLWVILLSGVQALRLGLTNKHDHTHSAGSISAAAKRTCMADMKGRWIPKPGDTVKPFEVPEKFQSMVWIPDKNFRGSLCTRDTESSWRYDWQPACMPRSSLEPLDLSSFCKRFGGKRILMLGDSLMGQQFHSLSEMLGGAQKLRSLSECEDQQAKVRGQICKQMRAACTQMEKLTKENWGHTPRLELTVCDEGSFRSANIEYYRTYQLALDQIVDTQESALESFWRSETVNRFVTGACTKALSVEDVMAKTDYSVVSVGTWFSKSKLGWRKMVSFVPEDGERFYERRMTDAFQVFKKIFEANGKSTKTLIFRGTPQAFANCSVFTKPLEPEEQVEVGHECDMEHPQAVHSQAPVDQNAKWQLGASPEVKKDCLEEWNWPLFSNYNKIAKRIVEDFGGRYLDVFTLTGLRPEARLTNDCLHMCLPGPFSEINKLMYNIWLTDMDAQDA